jgi:hypothetical protein
MIRIIKKSGPWDSRKKQIEVPVIDGGTIWDYIPQRFKRIEMVSIILNGEPKFDEELRSVVLKDGDELVLSPYPGILGFMLSVGLQMGAMGLKAHEQKALDWNRTHSRVGRSYEFPTMQLQSEEGLPIPVVDGEMRVPGQVLQYATEQYVEGVDKLNLVIGHCEGPIEAFMGNTQIDGNDSSNYLVNLSGKFGTLADVPIIGFDKTVTTFSLNSQLSRGSSIVIGGTAPAEFFRLKVTFITGMYEIDGDGHYHAVRFVCRLRYRTTAGPGAWSSWFRPVGPPFEAQWPGSFHRRRSTPFSIFFGLTFPSLDTYDVEIERDQGTGHDGQNQIVDAYVKEYQQFQNDYLRYPFIAKSYVEFFASDQMSGDVQNITTVVRGRMPMLLTSATTASAPAWTKNVSQLMLDKIFNWRFGGASRVDQRLQLTLSGVSGGPYTVGELVLGPTVTKDYQFRGFVRAWNNSTSEMLVESRRGLPYGILTGQTSAATGTVASIDESYGVNLASFWNYAQRCDEWVPDGSAVAKVNTDSPAAGNIVYVDDTSPFAVDDQIVIAYEEVKEEDQKVQAILAGPPRLQIYGTLANTHLAAEAAEVSVAERRHEFDHIWDGQEDLRTCLDRYARTSQAFVVYEPVIRVVPFRLETPTRVICRGNTGLKSFKIGYGSGPKNRANRVFAKFRDQTIDYNFNWAQIDLPELESNPDLEIIEENWEFFGKTRASEVNRQARFRVKRNFYVGKAIQLVLGPDHLGIQVGDTAYLQNDTPGIGLDGGRVVSGTASTVLLDRPLTIPAGTHFLRIQRKDDTQQSLQITNPPGEWKLITVSGSFSPAPVQHDLWAAGELGLFRCMGAKPNEDGDAVTLWEEDSPDFYTDKFGVVPTFSPTTLPDPNQIPPSVEDIRLIEGVARLPGGQLEHYIDVSFHAPVHNNYSYAEVWIKERCARSQRAGTTDFTAGPGTSPVEFSGPQGIWAGLIGTTKTVIVADTDNQRILGLDENLAFLWQIGTTGTQGDSSTLLRFPRDVACDGVNIYLLDTGNHKIKVYNATTQAWISTFGALGSGPGQFKFPSGIASLAGDAVVHVADTYNNRIQRFTVAAGVLTFSLQIGSIGSGNDQFHSPYGIDVGNTNVYVADLENHRITYRDKGTYVYTGQFGTGPSADPDKFNRTVDVTVDAAETYAWICDIVNHRLSTWLLSGPSNSGVKGSYGQGRDQFKNPHGIQNFDGVNYVVEKNNNALTVRDEQESVPDFFEFRETVPNGESSIRIRGDLSPGELYEIVVASVSPNDVRQLPTNAPSDVIELTAVGGRPPNVANLYAANEGNNVRLYWDGVQATDLAGYEIRAGTDWATGQKIGQVGRDVTEFTLTQSLIAQAGNSQYWIKAFTISRQFSLTATGKSHAHPALSPIASTFRVFNPINERTT